MREAIAGLVVALMVAGCSASAAGEVAGASEPPTSSPPPTSLPPLQWEVADEPTVVAAADLDETEADIVDDAAQPDLAETLLSSMSVDEKVGQLFMPVFDGYESDEVSNAHAAANRAEFGFETPSDVVAEYHLGGVIYLQKNIVSADQVGRSSAGLQESAVDDTGIGLLIAVDQEGGRVNRLTDGVTVFPPAAVLSGDREAVREAGYVTGSQVTGQGINVVLAPVADVTEDGPSGSIGNRSYGDDPAVVSDMVSAAIDGLQSSGVAAAAKHWPGHGATNTDSHERLPVLDIGKPGWEERDKLPFAAAIDSEVAIVLVGHLSMPAIDPSRDPATVSPVLIDELLRQELGFEGVVMTDALNMNAVDNFEAGELVVQALNAGADILLIPRDLPTAYEAVVAAVNTGEVSEERLDEAVLRVLHLKAELGLLPT